MAEVQEAPKCKCNVPAKIYTVRKPGPNTGRRFYKCGKGIGSSGACNFFQWAATSASTESEAAVAGTPPTPSREGVPNGGGAGINSSSGGGPPSTPTPHRYNNDNRLASVSSLSRPPPFSYDDPNITPTRLGAAAVGSVVDQGPQIDFPDSPTSGIRRNNNNNSTQRLRHQHQQSRLSASQEDQSSQDTTQSTVPPSSLGELPVPSSSVSLSINPPLVQAQLDSSPAGRTFLDQLSSLAGSVSDTLTRSRLKDKTIERQARKIVELEAEIEILNNRLKVSNAALANNSNTRKRSRSISFDDDDMGDEDDLHLHSVVVTADNSPHLTQSPQHGLHKHPQDSINRK